MSRPPRRGGYAWALVASVAALAVGLAAGLTLPLGRGSVTWFDGGTEAARPGAVRDADAGDRPAGRARVAAAGPDGDALAPLFLTNAPVNVSNGGFLNWAVMDRRTGEIWGSPNMDATSWPASMIKAWIAADYLRRATENGTQLSDAILADIEIMIRDSDTPSAIRFHSQNGREASIERMIKLCGLTDTTPDIPRGWSFTNLSARDGVRMADCIADGTAAGPQWTPWLLELMRSTRIGTWGIIDAVPESERGGVAIKNGWLPYTDDGLWHINCLAVTDTWAMVVMQRWESIGGWDANMEFGSGNCRDVATQLINPAYRIAAESVPAKHEQ